jgi:hypothetical protein
MDTLDYYDGIFFEIRFRNEDVVIGINYHDYCGIGGQSVQYTNEQERNNYTKVIDKAYKLYLEKWRDLFLLNQLKISVISLESKRCSDNSDICTPAKILIWYEDLAIKEKIMTQSVDYALFSPRRNSRKNYPPKEFDEYNYDSLGQPMCYEEGRIEGFTFNEIKKKIEEETSEKYINSNRIDFQNHTDKCITKIADKLVEKYKLDYKDAIDIVTRSSNDEWEFEYKTSQYDKLSDDEYWEILENTGYNHDCNSDSYEENIVRLGYTEYIKNRKIKQLVGFSKK